MTAFHRTKEWAQFVREQRPRLQRAVDAGLARCVDCGHLVMPWEPWDVGHRVPQVLAPQMRLDPSNVGPSHRRCNRRAGGKLGARRAAAKQARRTETVSWRVR